MAMEASSDSVSSPKAQTWCDHLVFYTSDLTGIPSSDTPCKRCQHPNENWLCFCCMDVLCSPFVNKHMVQHYLQTKRSHALSYRCSVIPQLRGVYETAYILKFGEAPSFRTV